MIDFAKETGAATITTRLSMEFSKQPLLDRVKDIWAVAVRGYGANIETAFVRGHSGYADTIETIDLIEDRMKDTSEIPSDRTTLDPELIWIAARASYEKRYRDLAIQFIEK
jgi:hypothetical protein